MRWRKKNYALASLLFTSIFLFSGYYLKITTEKIKNYSMSVKAFRYLNKALWIMQKNFVYKKNIDWDLIRKEAYKKAENAILPSDTYPAIQLARSLIQEDHGCFLSPSQREYFEQEELLFKSPIYYLIGKNIAYISLFTLSPIPDKAGQEYTKQVQGAICKLDSIDVDKWIIDLRENHGGNMWPMLLGLGSLLDEGYLGFFVAKNGKKIPWNHKGNAIKQGDGHWLKNPLPLYQLQNKPTIAVLIGNNTASSGEAVAIAFSGQENVRFFGQHTAGFTSAIYPFSLSDGACLLLPIMLFANRFGQVFTRIAPDEIISTNEIHNTPEAKDPTIEAAINWLCNP